MTNTRKPRSVAQTKSARTATKRLSNLGQNARTRTALASRSPSSSKTKRINSRNKGAVGERELAAIFTEHGISARRGQQHSGGVESPDVKFDADIPFHVECKRVQSGNLYTWLAQASRDAGNKIPIVAHRRNGRRWVAILLLEDFLNYVV